MVTIPRVRPTAPPPGSAAAPEPARWLTVAAMGLAVVSLAGFSLAFNEPAWTPKATAVLGFAALGLPLAIGIRRPGRVAALATLGIAAVATLLSGDIAMAVTGLYGHGAGLLLFAAAAGAWALGSTVRGSGRDGLALAVSIAVALNVVVAFIQVVWSPPVEGFGLTGGGATGLFGSPEHLGAVAAAGVVLAAWLPAGRWREAAVAAAAATVALSGTVIGAVMVLAAAGGIAVWRRGGGRRTAAVAGGAFLAATLVFVSFGPVAFEDAATLGRTTSQGLVTSAKTVVADPIFGTGPGLYRTGATMERTRAMAELAEPEAVWRDAHNLFAEAAATLGVAGAIALAVWIAVSLRAGRGRWRFVAALLVLFHLVAPLDPGVVVLMFLALGASLPAAAPPAKRLRITAVAALLPAVVLAGVLVVGDARLDAAYTDHRVDEADAAAVLFPQWTEPLDAAARAGLLQRITDRDPSGVVLARERYARAVEVDPTDPASWNRLAEVDLILGDIAAALSNYREALERYPWSVRARLGLAEVAIIEGRLAEARELAEDAQSIVPTGIGADTLDRIEALQVGTSG